MVFAGNTPVSGTICRVVRLPADNVEFIAAFTGALIQLTDPEYWDDSFGTLSSEDAAMLASEIICEYLESDVCMVGEVKMFARDMLPDDVLLCDGSQHLREDYPRLYEVLPASLIVDADTFIVPDLRDKFVLGAGTNVLTDEGGQADIVLSIGQLPQHNHTSQPHSHVSPPHSHSYTTPTFNIDVESVGVPDPFGVGNPPVPATTAPASAVIDPETVIINDTGANEPHDNMPPYYALVLGILAR